MAGDAEASAERSRYERSEAMGRDSISKLLLRYSGPAILANETSAWYNLFDAVWAGRIGIEAVAALSINGPLMAIYRAVGAGIGVGATSLIARNLGAGKREETSRIAGCSISFFFLIGGLLTIICLMSLEPLLRLFGAGDSVLPFAMSYMVIETWSIGVDFFLLVLIELVRVGGSPKVASAGMIIASLMDLIWSPILAFGIGPFPVFGIAGLALGTTIGRAIGVSLLLTYIGLGKSIYRFKPSYFIPNLRTVIGIYDVGISQTARASAASIAQILADRAAASFGVAPLALLGVLFRLNMIVFSFCMGIGQGMLPLVGYNFGAQKKGRIGEAVVKASLISLVWGAACWAVVTLLPTQILSLFSTDPDFLAGGPPALYLFALNFFVVGPQDNISFFFQGIGRAVPALVVVTSRQLIFLIPCLLIMPSILGLTGLWAAYPVAGVLSVVLSLIWASIEFRNQEIPFRLHSTSSAP